MPEFEPEIRYVGCGPSGAARVSDGIEQRAAAGEMGWTLDSTPECITVDDQSRATLAADLATVDLVVVTADGTEGGDARRMARVGRACPDDATCVAVVTGGPDALEPVCLACDTVVRVADGALAREFATDLFTWALGPMLLRTDHGRVYDRLDDGGLAQARRATGDRAAVADLAERTRAATDGDLLFGYLAVGVGFTMDDRDRFRETCERPSVVTGQSTTAAPDTCRLTAVRRTPDADPRS